VTLDQQVLPEQMELTVQMVQQQPYRLELQQLVLLVHQQV
jgi:hypothetical protein